MVTCYSGNLIGLATRPADSGVWQGMRRLTIAAILFAAPALAGEMNQYHFFDQYNWGDKTGIFLQIHHPGGPTGPAKLAEAQLGASLGDGQDWHAPRGPTDLEAQYALHRQAGGDTRQLNALPRWQAPGPTPGIFTVSAQWPDAAFWPEWGRGPAEYAVVQDSLDLTLEGKHQSVALKADDRPAQIRLLSPSFSQTNVAVSLPGTFEIEARFHFVASGTARELSPLMDPYFQVIQPTTPARSRATRTSPPACSGRGATPDEA